MLRGLVRRKQLPNLLEYTKDSAKRIALKNKSHVRTYLARPNIQAVWIKSGENPIQDLNSVGTLNPHRLNIWS